MTISSATGLLDLLVAAAEGFQAILRQSCKGLEVEGSTYHLLVTVELPWLGSRPALGEKADWKATDWPFWAAVSEKDLVALVSAATKPCCLSCETKTAAGQAVMVTVELAERGKGDCMMRWKDGCEVKEA